MDLSVFKNEDLADCINGDYKECVALNRLIVTLKYYATMNVKKNENDREIFASFMDVYTQIVDDNNHFMAVHSEQIKEIYDSQFMTKCNMKNCQFTERHFESDKAINIKTDKVMNFYVNLMDSLHFIICHCYDCGLRVEQNEQKNDDEVDDKTLFDAEFARINAIIRKTDLETAPFERISPQNNAKFVLANVEQGDTTFLDELYKELESKSMHIEKLREAVDREDYDSESIKMDVSDYGNIKICKQSIVQFIKDINVRSNTFSVGLRFYYWSYYEQRNELPANEQMIGSRQVNSYDNKHDHGGYKVSELCIKSKYDSFKEEAANYPNLNVDQYEAAKIKTDKFMKSNQIKAMSAKYTYHNEYDKDKMYLHYDIAFGALVSFYHILALIFYTDFSKLCTAFSATFRKIHPFETLASIKERNALYFWMSKYLRELVELFGQCSNGEGYDYDKKADIDALHGPFYCGMSFKMNIGSFAMRLNSPSSTSRTFAVALKFSGPDGVVFTFDNPKNDEQFCYLRSFACSHISCFKEEDECLFFGGFYRIKVVSVRLIKTQKNMQNFVLAIFEFDKALNGNHFATKTKNGYLIIGNLIKTKLNKQTKNTILPQYILDCFSSFCSHKQQISLKMRGLYNAGDDNINNLIFHSMKAREKYQEFTPNDDNFSNVVRAELFALFPNVTLLTIETDLGAR